MKRRACIVFAIFNFLSHTWKEPIIQDKVGTFQFIVYPEGILPKKDTENIACGYISAPESHLKSTDKTIKLFVAISKSTATIPNSDPIAFLSGGTG